ncbi:class I SAM-dependent methyltransferase [Atribacter laminatus]|jgi:O-methyltransferase involved in polyketide biosynthesis|uniref:Class I SAM-dependent methyltransferase n=1 Tax=Atribacter laminatus TaxID=2847778 RepID=A0A7T1AN91_ATRLM|nr:class I SAM-dependent methyltransferase [Atribacter laminatus]QPM69021.1 hypothetical protein RT761_02249 [Atribacter laminatus]
MITKLNVELGDVQKTLFLPLWGRAMESKKPHPLLIDDLAVKIIDSVNFDFSLMTRNLDDITQIAWIKRSLIGDQIIKKFINLTPKGTIVNIGCGLDTTFERIDNDYLIWYDLDLPDVIELRRKFIKEGARRKFIASSFLEKAWLSEIEIKEKALFIAVGILYYFQEQEIRDFIITLVNTFPGSELLVDVCSPLGMKIANKKVIESSGLDKKSNLVWGLKNKKDILAWDERIKLLGTYYYFRDHHFKGIRNQFMGFLSDLLGIQYVIHFQLGKQQQTQ